MEVSLASSYVPEYLKMKNRRMIFDAFRKRKLLSRAELASELAMSFPTVCKTIDFLISKDIIRDTGQQDNTSGPGRKRKLLEFNSESYCVFSLGFEGTFIRKNYYHDTHTDAMNMVLWLKPHQIKRKKFTF